MLAALKGSFNKLPSQGGVLLAQRLASLGKTKFTVPRRSFATSTEVNKDWLNLVQKELKGVDPNTLYWKTDEVNIFLNAIQIIGNNS